MRCKVKTYTIFSIVNQVNMICRGAIRTKEIVQLKVYNFSNISLFANQLNIKGR